MSNTNTTHRMAHRLIGVVLSFALATLGAVALLPSGTASAALLETDVVYREVDGVSIPLDIYRPDAPGPHSGILLIHGAWEHETKESYSELATHLADDGFVVYVPDYRAPCDPANSGSIDPALCGYVWTATVEDVMGAMSWIRAHATEHDTIPTQIAAFGGSGGGLLANHLGTTGTVGSTRPEAVISWSGFTAIYDYATSGDPARVKSGFQGFVGCPLEGSDSCPDEWVAASPLTYVTPGDAPTYLVNSSAEVTPVKNATDMATALQEAGVTASLRIIPGELHSRQLSSVVVDAEGTTVLEESEQFLREQLDAAPSVFASDAVVAETDGIISVTSTVHVIPPASGDVTVAWATADGTGTAGADYTAASGTVTIPAGQSEATLVVSLLGDDVVEGDEWFDVRLSGPIGATLGDTHALVYIDEDDTAPTPPVISSVTPKAGRVGASLTISGSGFSGATGVTFGGIPATFTVETDATIEVTIPSGALTGPVTVTTPNGSANSPMPVKVKPTLLSFTPASGRVGTTVTITGSAFTGATAVTFNGVAASFKVIDYGTIKAKVPSGATTGKITVITPGGKGTNATIFTVT